MSFVPFVHPRRWLAAFGEGELPEPKRRRVEAHLARCAACRARLADIERGLEAARALGPVPLPVERRRRIERLLAVPAAWSEPGRATEGRGAASSRRVPRRAVAAAALAAAALAAVALWLGGRRGVEVEAATAPPGRLEALALSAHARLSAGERPLELISSSPTEVRAWLARLGLSAALAEQRPPADAARYRLAGATDLSRPGLAAAAVLYEVDGEPLVLVAARQEQVPEVPRWSPLGKRVRHRRVGDTSVLTWTNSGKAYALAAAAPRVQLGCLLCHTDERRRELARDLPLPGS